MPLTKIANPQSSIIRLNNAATTPPFQATLQEVEAFLQTYGALHRGAGPHATRTLDKVNGAIRTIRNFLHVPKTHSILFTQNTSSAINLFARLLHLQKEDVVITSSIEHTSNSLPWRYNTPASVVEIDATKDGSLVYNDLRKKVATHNTHLKLITLTGASNQTGYSPDIPTLSTIAHENDALLFIDAAQLAPHGEINMTRDGIDALALSAHKLYAPFGLGVLVLPTTLLKATPVDPGGGSIDMISDTGILWAPHNERHQTGTLNVVGIIALAASCEEILRVGWENIEAHEQALVQHSAKKLSRIPKVTMHVPVECYLKERRIGTFPFSVVGIHHAKVAAILEHEYGIETRAGTICNHRLVRRWFSISDEQQRNIEKRIAAGDRLASYGIVRASIGLHNTKRDIDVLTDALQHISAQGPKRAYKPIPHEETFIPAYMHPVL